MAQVLKQLSEADIERTCTELLELDGWRALKTDPCSDRARGKGFGEIGMPDHLYIRYVDPNFGGDCVLWVEYKAPGRRPSPNQIRWAKAERAKGAMVWLAGLDFPPTIEGFQLYYRGSGLNRGRV